MLNPGEIFLAAAEGLSGELGLRSHRLFFSFPLAQGPRGKEKTLAE